MKRESLLNFIIRSKEGKIYLQNRFKPDSTLIKVIIPSTINFDINTSDCSKYVLLTGYKNKKGSLYGPMIVFATLDEQNQIFDYLKKIKDQIQKGIDSKSKLIDKLLSKNEKKYDFVIGDKIHLYSIPGMYRFCSYRKKESILTVDCKKWRQHNIHGGSLSVPISDFRCFANK